MNFKNIRTKTLISFCLLITLPFFTASLIAQVHSCEWHPGANSVHAKAEGQGVVVNDKIYAFGGFIAGLNVTPDTEIYNPKTNNWSFGAPMPIAVTHAPVVVVGNNVWLIAGFEGRHPGPAIADVQIYNTQTNSWSFGPSLPQKRGGGAAALVGSRIHYFGGLFPDRMTNAGNHWFYDLNNPNAGWQGAAGLPNARNHLSAAVVNGLIYAIGGQFGHDGGPSPDTDLVHVYNSSSNSWSQVKNLPSVRSHFEPGTLVYNNKIIIAGGTADEDASDDMIQYNPNSNSWSHVCDLPDKLLAPLAKIANNRLFLINGGINNAGSPLNTNRYIPLVSESLNNLALNKPAIQSSTVFGATASRAVNGDANGSFNSNSVTHTNDSTNPWWRVDLGATFNIENITINNRSDCCTDRLSGARVYVGNANSTNPNDLTEVGRLNTDAVQSVTGINTNGRYVMVHIPGHNKILSLSEVQVFGTPSTGGGNTGGQIVHIRKRNAAGFALDGQANGANGQNIHLWPQSTNNANQLWREIDRGNGFYSYQKVNTNHCIDGGNGAADNQNVHLWTCDANTHNQHWRKENVGGGAVRLVKRNATAFAINGGDGGSNGQNVNLFSNASSQNLHWFIQPFNGGTTNCSENVALGKSATQSSTLSHPINFSAGKAVDGNNSGNHVDASMTHTNTQNNAWWEIDLGQVYDLSSVRLWNRTSCCANRLSNFNVLVSNTPFNNKGLNSTINQNGVGHFPFPGTAGRQTNINLNRTGRYVRVQLSGTGILTLAEVEIMGCSNTKSLVGAEKTESLSDLSVVENKQPSNITVVEASDIHISPNPAIDYLNVDVSNYMNESIEYSIQSIDGATRMIGRLTSDHNKTVQLDISDINNGLYIMHMKPENHKAVAVKFVITN